MKKNELVTVKTSNLACKELQKRVGNIITAMDMGNKSSWIIAEEYNEIVTSELFEEDFESVTDFASYMGVSKGLISQYTKAINFIRDNGYFSIDDLSVVRAYTLSTLKDDLDIFVNWCNSNDRDILSMSDAGLKNTIKEWKKELEAIDECFSDDNEVFEETEEIEEIEDNIIEFEINGKRYAIPESVLANYEMM